MHFLKALANEQSLLFGKKQSTTKICGKHDLSMSKMGKKLVHSLNSWNSRFAFECNILQNCLLNINVELALSQSQKAKR